MARSELRVAENAEGPLYVDSSCIDCETCRAIAPNVFVRSSRAGQSVVRQQPADPEGWHRASMALVACPTASIGGAKPAEVKAASSAFPEPIAPDVFYCGYAAESSFGASSYLIRRPDGNVMVDSPRMSSRLLAGIRALGGARWMFLTHRDDVADHEAFHRELGCDRILHAGDVGRSTRDIEMRVEGDDAVTLAPDLTLIPVPGHTRGSMALLFRQAQLLTGDHLWGDEDTGQLGAGRSVCWYSWPEQLRSLAKLRAFEFTDVLPGHGRRFRTDTAAQMRSALDQLLATLRPA